MKFLNSPIFSLGLDGYRIRFAHVFMCNKSAHININTPYHNLISNNYIALGSSTIIGRRPEENFDMSVAVSKILFQEYTFPWYYVQHKYT